MRAVLVLLVLLVLAGAVPATASADVEMSTTGTGALTVSWRGDPARGCAENGVCDVTGTLVLTPAGDGSTFTTSDDETSLPDLRLASSGPRVVRGDPADPAGVCVDRGSGHRISLFTGFEEAPPDGGPTPLQPQLTTDDADGLSAGRCAGPAARDLEVPLLDPIAFDERELGRPRLTIAFPGRRTLAAGPWTIDVVSTLTLTSVRKRVPADPEVAGPVDEDEPRDPRRAFLLLPYEASALNGTLTTRFAGLPERGCDVFDACGVAGTQTLQIVNRRPTRLTVTASGPARMARGPRRVARMLAALRAGELRLGHWTAEPSARLTGTIEAAVTRAGAAATCRDRLNVPVQPLSIDGGRLSLGAENTSYSPVDRLRSRCPGPELAPARGAFLAARLDRRLLANRRAFTARMTPDAAIDTWPYSAVHDGALDVTLRPVGRPTIRVGPE